MFFWSTEVPLRRKVGSLARRVRRSFALPSIPVRFARAVALKVPGDFFSSLLMLCYCVLHVETFCALELVHQSDVFYSSVLQLCCATQSVQIAVGWLRQGSLLLRLRAECYCVLQPRVVKRIVVAA